MARESVNVHSVQPLNGGWEVTVYQCASRLQLPPDRENWARQLERARAHSRPISIDWDEDTFVIVWVEPMAG